MFPVEILNIWTDVCQKKHILWYLYGPTLLCAHGYGYFPEELSCAQVAVFQEDVQALKNEIFPYLRKRGYGVSNGNDNIQIVLHQNTVLSIYVLDREKQSAVFWKPKMMACEQKRGGQKKQFPVFSGYQDYLLVEFGDYEKIILPTEDIEESFQTNGSEAYIAEIDGKRVGGTIIVVDEETGYNSLHLLYVKLDSQNSGNGYKIWQAIEELHPETKIWETHTPYYDKRNIHFYINRCGFKIVEFFHSKHKDSHQTGESIGNIPKENNCFFRFEKEMN